MRLTIDVNFKPQPNPVRLKKDPNRSTTVNKIAHGTFSVHNGLNEHVGSVFLAPHASYPFVNTTLFQEHHQGYGHAGRAYDLIEKHVGEKLIPSPLGLSPNAVKMWGKRLSRGGPEHVDSMLKRSYAEGRRYQVPEEHLQRRLEPVREAATSYMAKRQKGLVNDAASVGPIMQTGQKVFADLAKHYSEHPPVKLSYASYLPNHYFARHVKKGVKLNPTVEKPGEIHRFTNNEVPAYAVKNDVEGIMTHEYGHGLHHHILRQVGPKKVCDFTHKFLGVKNSYSPVPNSIAPSERGGVDSHEYAAESFVAQHHNKVAPGPNAEHRLAKAKEFWGHLFRMAKEAKSSSTTDALGDVKIFHNPGLSRLHALVQKHENGLRFVTVHPGHLAVGDAYKTTHAQLHDYLKQTHGAHGSATYGTINKTKHNPDWATLKHPFGTMHVGSPNYWRSGENRNAAEVLGKHLKVDTRFL